MRWTDVGLSTRLLRLPMTKSGEWQTVPINENARGVLVRRMRLRDEVCPESSVVFFHETGRPGADVGARILHLQHSFNRACREAGIEDFRVHDLRHTFASWLVMEGVDIFKVSKLLLHGSVQMTERYAHLSSDYSHEAVDVLGASSENQRSGKITPLILVKEVGF